MFATSARSVPCIALASTLAALNTSVSPFFSTVIAVPNWRDSVPSGPLTEISPGPTFTSTFGGSLIGLLPMRDMFFSPSCDDAQYFATDAGGARLAIGHDAVRGRDDGDSQSVHDPRDIVLALVDAQARLRHTLDFFDHRPSRVVLQRDLQLRLGLVAHDGEALDVALVLEHLGDRQFDLGCGHLRRGLLRELRIADARQHVGDRISHAHVFTSTSVATSLIVAPGKRRSLPTGLDHAGNLAAHRDFAQLVAPQPELAVDAARASSQPAAVAKPRRARVPRQRVAVVPGRQTVLVREPHIAARCLA